MLNTGAAALAAMLTSVSLAEAQAPAPTLEYYHVDAIGSVRAVTNAQGQVVRSHDYHPFGEGVGTEEGKDPLRFAGKPRDEETGLDYLGGRHYEMRVGRLTSVDPAMLLDRNLPDPQSWNRYSHVKNNPLRYSDPDGRVWETIWDVGNLAYSGYKCLKGKGCGDLAWDAAATLIPFIPAGASKLLGSADEAVDLARSARALPAITATTMEAALKTAAESGGRQGTVASRALASHIDRGDPAFRGLAKGTDKALGLIRSILDDPARVAAGNKTVDVYNAAGQGVRLDRETGRFITFLEGSRATR
jgi:RHS repeat-associated protein